jgi:hypothetical protein
MNDRQPKPNFTPPASVHIPERAVFPEIPKPDALITITVAEYHCLTKAATMLEVILADKSYTHDHVVAAVRNAMQDMVQLAEAGAEE